MRSCLIHREFAHWQVVIKDKVTDDVVFLEKLVEAVRVLFMTHGPLQIGGDTSKGSMVLCICDCHRFALYPSEQNRARLRRSWADLGVYDRRALRKVVRLNDTARNVALLELTGMSVPKPWPSLIPVEPSTICRAHLGGKRLVAL